MIEVSNLVKDYGNHHAVKDISFTVDDGQIVGLLGPNGAGKSTTMNIMTGYISATSGTVKIGGCDILEEPIQAKKLIGYLPELPPLYEDMTVGEYLSFVCDLKGIRKKEDKIAAVTEVEEAVKITEVKGRLIKNLSKGYKQRVGLAQALIGNPPLLILDEPTVGLDPNQIIEIRSLIKSLAGKHTIILSSHILSEVNAICDYVLIIDKGMVIDADLHCGEQQREDEDHRRDGREQDGKAFAHAGTELLLYCFSAARAAGGASNGVYQYTTAEKKRKAQGRGARLPPLPRARGAACPEEGLSPLRAPTAGRAEPGPRRAPTGDSFL